MTIIYSNRMNASGNYRCWIWIDDGKKDALCSEEMADEDWAALGPGLRRMQEKGAELCEGLDKNG